MRVVRAGIASYRQPLLLRALREFPANFTAFVGLAMMKSDSILKADEFGLSSHSKGGNR